MPDARSMADLLRLGSAQREDALLQAQMQQAAQAAQPRGRVYGTAGGAIMGGLGDGLREMVGGFRQQDLIKKAEEAERGRVDPRQQWLSGAYGLGSPAGDASGMAAALRRQAVAEDIAKLSPPPETRGGPQMSMPMSAALRGQPAPAGVMPIEQSPQEQAAGMAAALRGEAPQPDALTSLAPYQRGAILAPGAAQAPSMAAPAGQTGEPAPIGGPLPSDPLRAKLTQAAPYQPPAMDRNPSAFAPDRYGVALPTPAREMGRSQRPPEAKMSAPAVAPPAPQMPDLTLEQRAEIAIASGDPAMMAWGKTVLEQANLRAEMDAKQRALDAAAKAKAKTDEDAAKDKQFDDMLQLRAQFNGLEEVRKIKEARSALERMQSAGENGAGDLVRIYGFMRQLDPLGSVRQDDFANVGRAGGLPSQVQAYFDVLQGKGALAEPMRRQIEKQSYAVYKAQLKSVQPTLDAYKRYETDAGFAPGSIVPDYGLQAQPMKSPPPEAMILKDGTRVVRQTNGTYLPE